MCKTPMWKTAEGQSIPIDAMSDFHVFNSIRMLFRRHDLPYEEMPESVAEARIYLKNYISNREKREQEIKKRGKFIPRYFGGTNNYEPWDEHEGSWLDCH